MNENFYLPKAVKVVEVLPRDGLQSWSKIIDTDKKIKIIDYLHDTGCSVIEATSFVPKKVIPQFYDANEVMEILKKKQGIFRALAPNLQGAKNALASGCHSILTMTSCSETYSKKNQNKTIEENLAEVQSIIKFSQETNMKLTIALTNAFSCVFEGRIEKEKVYSTFRLLYDSGCRSFYLGDTVGDARPDHVFERLKYLTQNFPEAEIGLHLHDRDGYAFANVLAGLQAGVTTFESSMLGIGGGIVKSNQSQAGNIDTNKLVRFFHQMNISTGIVESKLEQASRTIQEILY